MDQNTRELMTVYKVLHPNYDIKRLYVTKKKKRKNEEEDSPALRIV